MCSLVTSIFLNACKSWTLTAELQSSIQTMEMRCFRKLLRSSYKDHVTNEEFLARSQQAIGQHEDLPTIVKKCSGYGHVSRSPEWRRGRRQGRQKKRWEDNIRKRTGLELAKSQRAVENGEKWRKTVVKSFVVPRRPSRLRDKRRK